MMQKIAANILNRINVLVLWILKVLEKQYVIAVNQDIL